MVAELQLREYSAREFRSVCVGGERGVGGVNYEAMQSYICPTAHLTFLVIADSLDDNGHLAIL